MANVYYFAVFLQFLVINLIEDYLCLEDGNVFFILSNHPFKVKEKGEKYEY